MGDFVPRGARCCARRAVSRHQEHLLRASSANLAARLLLSPGCSTPARPGRLLPSRSSRVPPPLPDLCFSRPCPWVGSWSVIVWINGAFGAGKTQTAYELARRLESASVVDPEVFGLALHKMLPPGSRGDFQDLPQWRAGTLASLRQIEAAVAGAVIVPMTLVRDEYFEEIIGGLRSEGTQLRHYSLIASPATLRRRLRLRSGYGLARLAGRDESWAIQQIDRCVAALESDRYATQIDTNDRVLDEVVERIAHDCHLGLVRPRDSRTGQRIRRLTIGLRHVRL
jgi:AAA domain